jgi:nicotinamidase-related amidase
MALRWPTQSDELSTNAFARIGALSLDGFTASGAEWLDELKPFIEDSATVVAGPHKVWGPQTNDFVLQLRKRRITKVVLCGMLANMCVESHLCDLLEQGFEVTVVRDATAGPRHPTRGDGYQAALVNYAFLAHALVDTDEIVAAMEKG